jgi:hypothetical protein
MAASSTSFPCRGIIIAVCVTSFGLLRGNPRFGSPRSDDDGVFGAVLPPGDIVLEQVLAGGAMRWSGVESTSSTMACLGGVAQWGLGDGSGLMGARRMVAMSGVVVASTAEGPGKVNALIPPEDGTAEDGSGEF